MKSFFKSIPRGVTCILIIVLLFGYMGSVMGLTNMLNTIMNTAHELLLNTVFYLMGMCVITGALGKILVEFGVVDLLQRLLRPVMKPLFNMPGVASLGAVLTFLSDNPAIIALSQDKGFARYFKKYQHVSLVNFGTAFGMGLLVIVFMVGQGYFGAPFIGFAGAICGCIIATRLMQYFTLKDFPNYKYEDAIPAEEFINQSAEEENEDKNKQSSDSTFIRVLNALLDGGKDGVTIGLAIIPGVLIISTFVMMLTFGGSSEGMDQAGNPIVVYTGAAFQGTQLLPMLAGKVNLVFNILFGFDSPELVAFPITALGAVGAALGLIPEFAAKGIIDGNAIAVCTAMGMCWSGYLSTDAATLDSLGYRPLVPRAFLSTFLGGICAGIITHWLYVGIMAIGSFFAPQQVWEVEADAWNDTTDLSIKVRLEAMDDGTYIIHDWYDVKGTDIAFTVNPTDSTVTITNAYASQNNEYFFVSINPDAYEGKTCYAAVYPVNHYSMFEGDEKAGHFYTFVYLYDRNRQEINRCYYEITWGGRERQTFEAENFVHSQVEAERAAKADSIAAANAAKAEKVNGVIKNAPK